MLSLPFFVLILYIFYFASSMHRLISCFLFFFSEYPTDCCFFQNFWSSTKYTSHLIWNPYWSLRSITEKDPIAIPWENTTYFPIRSSDQGIVVTLSLLVNIAERDTDGSRQWEDTSRWNVEAKNLCSFVPIVPIGPNRKETWECTSENTTTAMQQMKRSISPY